MGKNENGVKYDADKPPLYLIPTEAIEALSAVLAFGAKKYGERNWEKGMAWSRLYAAALRHLFAWWKKEEFDKETGYSHLWHALACIAFLVTYEMRKKEENDDRV